MSDYWALVVSEHLSVLGLVDQRLGVVPVRSTLSITALFFNRWSHKQY